VADSTKEMCSGLQSWWVVVSHYQHVRIRETGKAGMVSRRR